MHAQMDWSDQSEPFLSLFNGLNFTNNQTIEDLYQIHIADNQLLKRWSSCQTESFCIAEIGFGTGLSFLLTCLQFEQFLHENPDSPLKKIFYSSFEKAPLNKEDLILAFQKWPTLKVYSSPLSAQYPLTLSGCHRLHVNNITLDLWVGDLQKTLFNLYFYQDGLFDYWLFDGFITTKNPDTWNQSLFQFIAQSAKKNATLTIRNSKEGIKQGLQAVGFTMHNRGGYADRCEILTGNLIDKAQLPEHGQYCRPSKINTSKDVAIIGGGISSACLSLALINRGYHVTLYCKDATLGRGASGNQQGALYPLLNKQHDALSELFANSFLYTRNYVEFINQSHPFDFDLSGLLQLYYDEHSAKKLDKILQANLPTTLVEKITPEQTDKLANLDIGQSALHYPLAGWLSPSQMVDAIFKKAQQTGQLTINLNHHLSAFEETENGWSCTFEQQTITHQLLILTTAMKTLDFKQCEALPLSAARGQVTHIKSTLGLQDLKLTLCHEGYLTPINNGFHCMGATFKRHNEDEKFSRQEQTDNKNKLDKCIKNKNWVKQINIQHTNANVGIRCTTRDHFPYMGAMPDYQKTKLFYQSAEKKMPSKNAPVHNNLFILTGLGSRGLNTAPLLAETLASQINHEPLPVSKSILNAMQCNRQWINYLKKGKTLKF
jgi:tRNA 5-methylaminomethyl-2-thiouridine biosynthesis bifunctional protein